MRFKFNQFAPNSDFWGFDIKISAVTTMTHLLRTSDALALLKEVQDLVKEMENALEQEKHG